LSALSNADTVGLFAAPYDLIAAFQPTRLRPNLILMGLMATLTGLLLFLVVEASNIYAGGTALPIPTFGG